MNQQVKKLWLEALRSGDYEQGNGYLNDDNKFCCLGVLCDVYRKEQGLDTLRWTKSDLLGGQFFLEEYSVLPDVVVIWAGLLDSNPYIDWGTESTRLSVLNDVIGANFLQIADVIEQQL